MNAYVFCTILYHLSFSNTRELAKVCTGFFVNCLPILCHQESLFYITCCPSSRYLFTSLPRIYEGEGTFLPHTVLVPWCSLLPRLRGE